MESTIKFQPGEAVNDEGEMVPSHGFSFNDMFIVNARVSECGRFTVSPSYYSLTEAQADELAALNTTVTS